MYLAIPPDRIIQPLSLRKTEHGLDVRAHISFTDASIQEGHKDDGRDLLDKRPISGVEARQLIMRGPACCAVFEKASCQLRRARIAFKETSEPFDDAFRFLDIHHSDFGRLAFELRHRRSYFFTAAEDYCLFLESASSACCSTGWR